MKVAMLLLNQGRGSGEVTRQQAKHLIKRGHQVCFMHPRVGKGVAGAVNLDIELGTARIPVHEYLPAAGQDQQAVSTMSYKEAMAYLPAYERALESVIDGVDIVIGHHANISAVATHNVARRHARPYVLFLHGTGIEPRHHGLYDDRIWRLIEQAVRQAKGIIVTTEYVRDQLVRSLIDLPLDRFIVLPCGIDLDEFNPANTDGIAAKYALPETYVICPGALTASKGPQNVVAASERYADLSPTIFIGAGELRKELERKLGDRGRFLGFVPSEDKARLINTASLLVAAPEKKEHFGIIYAEALAGGTPAVAYKGGGVSSIVTPEVGILTERNPARLGQAVRGLLQDKNCCSRMALAARARAEAHFCCRRLAARLEQWLSRFYRHPDGVKKAA